MKRIVVFILLCIVMYHVYFYIENQKSEEINKALYCFEYGNKIRQTKYINGNCYVNGININNEINSYYQKRIY